MTQESAVHWEANSRIHIGLAVKDLEPALTFYRTLFGQEPTKVQPHYAKFEPAEPLVNLSLSEVGGETDSRLPAAHFGIQVKSMAAVEAIAERLAQAAVATEVEENVTCCYAVQNKVWATDPDGNKWEVYVVIDNDAGQSSSAGACCPEVPAVMEAVQQGDLAAAKDVFEQSGGMSACSCLTNSAP